MNETNTNVQDLASVADAPSVVPTFEPKLEEVKTVGYVQTDEQIGANDPVVA